MIPGFLRSRPKELFDRKVVGLVEQVRNYLPACRVAKAGSQFTLADFSRTVNERPTWNWLRYIDGGLLFKRVEQLEAQVDFWKVGFETGEPFVSRYIPELGVCWGSLEDETIASRASVEAHILMGSAIALRIRDITGEFGAANSDNPQRYELIRKEEPSEEEINNLCREYERKRIAELCEQIGIKRIAAGRRLERR